jgi:hypothetical protein
VKLVEISETEMARLRVPHRAIRGFAALLNVFQIDHRAAKRYRNRSRKQLRRDVFKRGAACVDLSKDPSP